ncbi:DUF695 domain-containing protein [Chitinophagaceae bacterium LB-8]|uniref:DUF695 domain-containing protein n=1 Tax=Paraflavisolibacter caeni TaxID=2982496 RepID=A0A9X3BI50_9BACT|nr:DUF695 domain-containing protein [Paraflavisolibacter caeni]MCU7550717.1 DUF695 domain-containing protein [Paraflavisolibacter caeni]
MKQFRVVIPKEKYSIIEFIQDGLPGVGVINLSLRNFEPKEVFAWHLSILIDFDELIENGMPSGAEREVVDPFGEKLDTLIKGANPEKPNALFLARITWNKTRELIWRVFEPEVANQELQNIIENNSSPRGFDYRMEEDIEWQLAQWHLKNC